MSEEQIKEIIGKAVVDEDYRNLLFTDPDRALEGYQLSQEEIDSIKNIEPQNFDSVISDMEERISRAGLDMIGVDSFTIRIKRTGLDKANPKLAFDYHMKN